MRHESDIGWWEMVRREAAPRLRRHVRGYCGYEEETTGFTRRRELPSGDVTLIVGFGPRLRTTYPRLERASTHRSFVAGLHDTHCIVETPGYQSGIQVNLTPIGAYLLLGLPMHELTNQVVELDDLFAADLLVEELYEAPDWTSRFALMDSALLRRLDRARPAAPDVAWAWSRLAESRGRLQVGELCEEVGCSRKHMLRRFHEQIGVPPKTYARLLRFQRAVGMLRAPGPNMAWGEIALECGWFDQAHMNRDFRLFAGASPGALAASVLPDGGGLAG